MGQSVDAYIAFGIDCGHEESMWLDESCKHEEIVDALAEKQGLVDPYDTMIPPEINADYEAFKKWKLEHPEFEEAAATYRDTVNALEETIPVEANWYGAEEYRSLILYIKGTQISGGWERSVKIDPVKLAIPDNIDTVRAFCDQVGLKPFEDPQWILFARLF